MDTRELQQKFKDIYGVEPEYLYFAPGRVNLIGEHIDYNGGRVFPCALTFGTYLMAAKRLDSQVALASLNIPGTAEVGEDALGRKSGKWTDYPMGVMKEFVNRGYQISRIVPDYPLLLPWKW